MQLPSHLLVPCWSLDWGWVGIGIGLGWGWVGIGLELDAFFEQGIAQ